MLLYKLEKEFDMSKVREIEEARVKKILKQAKKAGLDFNKVSVVKSKGKSWFDKALEKKSKS
jgi:site-specific recombinase XerC